MCVQFILFDHLTTQTNLFKRRITMSVRNHLAVDDFFPILVYTYRLVLRSNFGIKCVNTICNKANNFCETGRRLVLPRTTGSERPFTAFTYIMFSKHYGDYYVINCNTKFYVKTIIFSLLWNLRNS